MLADETYLNPLLTVEAKIQSRVATFLLSKEKLLKLAKSSSITVSDRAKSLLASQDSLQGQLANALASIERLKAGAWTFSEVANLTAYAYSMDKQIRNVEDLEKESAKGVAVGPFGDWVDWLPYALIVVPAALLVGSVLKSRKRR